MLHTHVLYILTMFPCFLSVIICVVFFNTYRNLCIVTCLCRFLKMHYTPSSEFSYLIGYFAASNHYCSYCNAKLTKSTTVAICLVIHYNSCTLQQLYFTTVVLHRTVYTKYCLLPLCCVMVICVFVNCSWVDTQWQ